MDKNSGGCMKVKNINNVHLEKIGDSKKNGIRNEKFEAILGKTRGLEAKENLNHIGRLRDEKLYNSLMSNYISNLISTQYANKSLDEGESSSTTKLM